MNASHWIMLVGGLLSVLSSSTICGQEKRTSEQPGSVGEAVNGDAVYSLLQNAYRSKAAELKFVLGDRSSVVTVRPKPVFTWSSLGGWSGDVFVWTGNGRIQVVGCIGSQRLDDESVRFFQEFHSLTDDSIEDVQLDAKQLWRIPRDKTLFKPIPAAPIPAATAALRLVQMRRMARSFNVGMQVTQEEVEQELRLLTQPVAREIGGSAKVIDSALFAFVSSSGTDPEAFLLVEARRMDRGLVWTFAAARFTTREIWMSREGTEVWRAAPFEKWDWDQRIDESYFYRNESTVKLTELRSGSPLQ